MTPIVPRGSDTGSSPTTSVETSTGLTTPDETRSSASSASDFYQPFRLSLESSYLLAGEGGFPLRVGVLGRWRPAREIGFGLRFDSNFSDQLTAGFRIDGIVPIAREFSIYAAAEVGVRALFNQAHSIQETLEPLSGALLNLGVEAGADFQVHPNVGLGIFARLAYAPTGALSMPGESPNPPRGADWGGGAEFLLGIRVSTDFGNGSEWPDADEEDDAPSAPLTRATDAIEEIEELVEEIQDEQEDAGEPGSTSSPVTGGAAPTSPNPEDLRELRDELRELRRSSTELEVQIAAATRIFRDLQLGQDAGTALRIRLDRFYDSLTARPATLDLPAFETFLTELEQALQENQDLQLLIRSSTETFGAPFLRNLTEVQTQLQNLQRSLPASPRRSDGLSRASLYPLFPRLTSILTIVQDLRNRPIDTRPGSDRITLWRENLTSIERRIESLAPSLEPEMREQIQTEFTRLRTSFETLTGDLQETERMWLISRAGMGHYQSFRDATRPEAALAALQAMLAEFEGAPEAFRTAHARGLENIRVLLVAFIDRNSSRPRRAWTSARETAIRVVQWIDPAYQPPAVAAPRRRPRDPEAADTEPRPRGGDRTGERIVGPEPGE